MERLWMGLLVMVPVLPKVEVVNLGGMPILLDDFVLNLAVLIGIAGFVLRASVTGSFRLALSCVAPLFGYLILYKSMDLGILALFYPWTDRWGIGKGVLVSEGVLVLGKSLAFFFVYVLFYSCLRDLELIHSILKIYIFSILIVVVVGLVQFFALGHRALTSTFRNVYILGTTRARGGFGMDDPWFAISAVGHEHLGAFAILSASILGGMLLCQWPPRLKQRHLIGLLWMGCIFCLIFSASRGAWIGGSCALVVFAWFAFKKRETGKLVLLSMLIAFSLISLKWWWDVDVVGFAENRTTNLFAILSGEVKDDSAKNRISLLQSLWDTFLDSPLVGWGPGGAGRIAEGQFVRELVEGGLIGGGLFIYIMTKIGRIALKAYRSSNDPMIQGVSIGFVCGLAGLFGQALFTDLFILTKIGTPFWILAAIVHKLYRLEHQQPATA